MFLEIVTPEAVLFSSEVTSVIVPGVNGDFQMLNNHTSVVSILKQGTIRIEGFVTEIDERFTKENNEKLILFINSGTLELKDNKVIILAD